MTATPANRLDALRRLRHDAAGEVRMSGVDGIGEAVTGGIIARTLEPAAGEPGRHQPGKCLNCATTLAGDYCHQCGQQAHVHRSVSAFWHDIAHSVLHFEGKIWRTLPLLAWRPGELTRRYVEGERARFVSPMALFLFTVFLMFAVFSALGTDVIGVGDKRDLKTEGELAQVEKAVTTLEAQRRILMAKNQATAKVDEDLKAARTAQAVLRATTGGLKKDTLVGGKVDTGWPKLDAGIKKANENPALLFYKVQSNAYKFSWALIPISVPFLWLLFLHRQRYRQQYRAYDHLVFITYSIAFMSMLMIVLLALHSARVDGGWLVIAGLVIPPFHIYRQLAGAYQLRRRSALWRTVMLIFFASLAMTLFSTLLLALGVLG
jgi:hypothetical protein